LKRDNYRDELLALIPAALKNGKHSQLEQYLTEKSALPGTRMNTTVVDAFAAIIGEMVGQPDPPTDQIEALLDGWAKLSLESAPVNDPREILPAAAVMAYGHVAVARPDWWDDEIAKLRKAAADERWRMRELVATALQHMLEANWDRTYEALCEWVHDENPLVVRAAAAGVAEPGLLTDDGRAINALSIQAQATGWLMRVPSERRREEPMRTLRKALGFTLGVAAAALPEQGFMLLEKLAARDDNDVHWIVRENLKKARFKPWADKVEALQQSIAE
jgi:hypothetical protein